MSPFQPAMLNSASSATLPHSARGIRIELPDQREIASMPSAAKGSVNERKVSGAISVTPIFRIGQLKPHISVNTPTGKRAAIVTCDAPRVSVLAGEVIAARRSRRPPCRQRFPIFALVELARLRHPGVATNAAGKLGQLRVDLVDVTLGPVRDLAECRYTQLVQHPFEHRTDADDQLEVIRRIAAHQR